MSGKKIGPGRLVAVVGPSGSGKDSIMRAARLQLAGESRILFPRRVITRAPDVHEDHVPVSWEEFREAEAGGAFALSWHAHGLGYGTPRAIDDAIRDGSTVVLNLSRGIVPLLRERYRNLAIISIRVDPKRLLERLEGRGREAPDRMRSRVERAQLSIAPGPDLVEIDNDGVLEDAVRLFLQALREPRG